MWELDHEEGWALKNWCFRTVVLKKTLESRLDCKEIQPVHPKGDQCWVFIGRTDVEAETPILQDPDAGKDWRQKEKGMIEDEMVGWIADSMDIGLGGLWKLVLDREAWRAAFHGIAKSQTRLSDWTDLNWTDVYVYANSWKGNGNPLQYSCLENPHGRRNLSGYSPCNRRVRHDWASEHNTC